MAFTRKKHSNRKRYIILSVTGLFVIGATLLVLEKTGVTNFYSRSSQTASSDLPAGVAPPNTVDYSSPANSQPDPSINTEKNPVQTDPATVTDNSLSVTITRAGQDSAKGFAAVAAIGGTTSGTCTLELSKDGAIILQRTTAVKQEGTLNVCYDFYTPKGGLPASGTYTLKISVADDSKQGSATQSVTIE